MAVPEIGWGAGAVGFRARKSFKVMPGVRMTVTPRGVSTSVGARGAHVSVHSSGRVTKTVGIPGTGVSHITSTSPSRRTGPTPTPAPAPAPAPPAPPKPGAFAPKWEKALYQAAVAERDPNAIRAVAAQHHEATHTAALLEAVLGARPTGQVDRARDLLAWLWSTGYAPEADPFLTRYLPGAAFAMSITPEVTARLDLNRDALGLMLGEVYQDLGDLTAAVDVVEQVTPSTLAAVSLAELYGLQERWADIIDLTNGLTNEDESSMILLIQRAAALRVSGSPDAAREVLREALRLRSRPIGLRHHALIERAYTYLAEGKPGMARKDLAKVQGDDAAYPGLAEALAQLPE